MGADPLTTGITKILTYVMGAITGLIPVVGGVMVGLTALKKMQSTDESEVAALNNRMKRIAIYAAVGMVASALVTWALSFF